MFVEFIKDGKVIKSESISNIVALANCGLKEAKDFVDTYCDYVL